MTRWKMEVMKYTEARWESKATKYNPTVFSERGIVCAVFDSCTGKPLVGKWFDIVWRTVFHCGFVKEECRTQCFQYERNLQRAQLIQRNLTVCCSGN